MKLTVNTVSVLEYVLCVTIPE